MYNMNNTFVAESLLNQLTGSVIRAVVIGADTARDLAQQVVSLDKQLKVATETLNARPTHTDLWDATDEIDRKEEVIQDIQYSRRCEKQRYKTEIDRLNADNFKLRDMLAKANAEIAALTLASVRFYVEVCDCFKNTWTRSVYANADGYSTRREAELVAASLSRSYSLKYRVVAATKVV